MKKFSPGAAMASLASTTVSLVALAVLSSPMPVQAQAPAQKPAQAQAQTIAKAVPATRAVAADASIERGRYLVRTTGCNDCHTPGYGEAGGKLPESQWLTGSNVGFRGPWGTSYPANLRLSVGGMTEDQWLGFARVERLPPMPWFSLTAMTDSDLRAMYRYIRSLGPAGQRAPASLPPGQEGKLPYIPFMPQAPRVAQR